MNGNDSKRPSQRFMQWVRGGGYAVAVHVEAVFPPDDPSVQRAAQYLIDRQNEQGSWDEESFTGTGFPKVFYLKYHLYRHYFPLFALARYRRMT